MGTLTLREFHEIRHANESGARPVVFIHGLWLLAGSWDPWRGLFEQNGFVTLAPGWPGDPESVEEAHAHPGALAGKSIRQVSDGYAEIIRELKIKPVLIGHSFGGLIAQRLAGEGLAAVTVAIDPAAFRGVLPLPLSSVRAALVALRDPGNYNRAVELSFEEFQFAFANAVPEDEARRLYDTCCVAAPGKPLFQAAAANLNPWTEAAVNTTHPQRGPLLIISGQKDHTVPRSVAHAAWKRQRRNPHPTEIRDIPNRGHSLTIDSGWREVADVALAFVQRYLPQQPPLRVTGQPVISRTEASAEELHP